ncbi:MAG: hypothetical protein GY822_24505 [Deltaproteobacteria bacterium]|nr:hypothetical protein [Deltaproteobacteria bacterium]
MSEPRGVLNDAQLADINQSIAPIIKTCADLLDDAVKGGVLQAGDNLQRIHLVWGSVHGLLHFKKRDRANPAANLRSDALLKSFFQTLFSAWGADEAAFEAAYARVVTERETPLCVG